jgi:PAS domain S-box-containing protein
VIEDHRLQLRDSVAAIAAAEDERAAARAAAETARTLADAERAAVYIRVPGLGWRRTGGSDSRALPAVVPDPDASLTADQSGNLVEIDLLRDGTTPVLGVFRDIGIRRLAGAPFSVGEDIAAYLVAFDPSGPLSPERRDAFSAIAIHLGAVLDRIAGTDRFRAVADAIPQLVWTANADGTVEWCNSRWVAYTGLTLDAMIEGERDAALHPDDFEAIEWAWHSARESGEPFELVYRLRNVVDGAYRWHLMRSVAMRDASGLVVRWFCTATDIDESRRQASVTHFLARATETIGSTLDIDTTLQTLVDVALPELGDWCVARLDYGGLHHVAAAHVDTHHAQALVDADFPPPGTSLVLPLSAEGEIAFGYAGGGRSYDERLVRTAQELVRRAVAALENAARYERERRVADTLQRALLPAYLPSERGLRFHAAYRPNAEEANVGGDWYDAFRLPSGRIAISIGDVGGHGLDAAITMGRVREMIRTAAISEENPATILARVDDVLTLGGNETMITVLVGIIDRDRSLFRYASAGHPSPLIALPDRTVHILPGGDVPLGIGMRALYVNHDVTLVPDSLMVLYTDGLLEFDRDLIRGEARIIEAASAERGDPHVNCAEAIVDRILSDTVHDDIAVLAVSIDTISAPVLSVTFDAVPESAPQARAVITAFARELGLAEERLFDLTLAVGEATNNAIEHAYADGGPGRFALRASVVGGRLFVEIEDRGNWRKADRPNQTEPELELDERGRGIALMRMLSEGVSLERTATGTVVRLSFSLFGTG